MSVKFGAGLLGHISATYDSDKLADLVQFCDTSGFDTFWQADQRWMRDVYASLTLCAARTERIQLGTRVTDPYVRHPALTAVAIATLDEISHGRAILGMGAGGSGFVNMGKTRERPVVAIREAIDLIRQLWAGQGEVDFNGQIVQFHHGQLEFRCRPDIPAVIAARGPLILRLAGEIADGVIIASMASRPGIQWAIGEVGKGCARAGRSVKDVELMSMVYTAVSDDAAAARRSTKRGIAGALSGSHPNYQFVTVSGLKVPDAIQEQFNAGLHDLDHIVSLIPDEFCEHFAIAGTAEDCVRRVREIVDSGIQHIVLAPTPADGGSVMQVVETFAKRVLPEFK